MWYLLVVIILGGGFTAVWFMARKLRASENRLADELLRWTNRYMDTMHREDDGGKLLDKFALETALEFSGAKVVLLLEAYGRSRHFVQSTAGLPPRASVLVALRKDLKGAVPLEGWRHTLLEWEWQDSPETKVVHPHSEHPDKDTIHFPGNKQEPPDLSDESDSSKNDSSTQSREISWIVDYRTVRSNGPSPEPLDCPGLWLIPVSSIGACPKWLALGGPRRKIQRHLPKLVEFVQEYLDDEGAARQAAGLSEVFKQSIENSRDAQALLVSGHLHYLNQSFETMTGYPREKLLGKPIQSVILNEDLLEVQKHLIDLPNVDSLAVGIPLSGLSGDSDYFEARICRQDGSHLHAGFSLVAVPYQGESAWMITARDVSSRVNLEQTLIDKSAQQELIIEELLETGNRLKLQAEDYQTRMNECQQRLQLTDNIVNGISDWVWVVDKSMTVTYLNQSMRLAMGNPIGKKCHQSLGHAEPCSGCPMNTLFETGTPQKSGIAIGLHSYSTYFFPLLDSDGSVQAAVEVFQDISELKRLEESMLEKGELLEAVNESVVELNRNLERATVELAGKNEELERLNEELKTLDQMKDNFVSTVSHELRAPLTSIKGSVGLILGGMVGEPDSKMAQFLTICQRNADRLLNLINDLLDLSRIESGKMTIEPSRCALKELATEAIENLSTYATEHHVELRLEVPDDLTVFVDHDRFIQVLQNLLSNALKFTESGEVVVRAEKIPGAVQVEVKDTGVGIPAEHLEMIFGKFTQVDSTLTRKVGGTGLGLAICRAIVEEHGGNISAESVVGKGSCFQISLPDHAECRETASVKELLS
jgi:signal transduction histidine kinase